MEFTCEEVNLEWLRESMVGWVKDPLKFQEVQEAFLVEGMSSTKIRYLGDNMVLLSGDDGEKLSLNVEENQDWLSEIFIDLKPWNKSIFPGVRLVWTWVSGLPLYLWSEDCFRKILMSVGSVVDMAEETKKLLSTESARVLVRTSANSIDLVRKIKINGVLWEVRAKEECSYGDV